MDGMTGFLNSMKVLFITYFSINFYKLGSFRQTLGVLSG
jgi:hypothetical protein